jgi:hypothetical protein
MSSPSLLTVATTHVLQVIVGFLSVLPKQSREASPQLFVAIYVYRDKADPDERGYGGEDNNKCGLKWVWRGVMAVMR